jgi:hypothetical protein
MVLIELPHAARSHVRFQPCIIVRIDKCMTEFFAALPQTSAAFDES